MEPQLDLPPDPSSHEHTIPTDYWKSTPEDESLSIGSEAMCRDRAVFQPEEETARECDAAGPESP